MMHATENAFDNSNSYPLIAANHLLSLEMLRAQRDLRQAGKGPDPMSRQVERDGLTGLPNRALFADQFMQAVAGARCTAH
jgi:GGDEF domain-containing protein